MARYLLITRYGGGEDAEPMASWDPSDIEAHIRCLQELNEELVERGELVDAVALTDPELSRTVASDGSGAPVVTDGPFAESHELLAGFQLVDVESEERAIEIAARVSAAPGAGGVPLAQPIEVRQVMGPAPGVDS